MKKISERLADIINEQGKLDTKIETQTQELKTKGEQIVICTRF